MASAAIAGRIGFVGLSLTSTGTSAEIAEIRDWRLSVKREEIDVTSNDSSGWHENIAGIGGWSGTASAMYVRTDNEQVFLRESLSSAATLFFTFRPSTAASALWSGTARVVNYDVGGAHDGATLFNVEFVGTRSLTYTT